MRRGEKCDIDTSRRVGRSQSWAICFPSRSGSRFKKRKFLIVLCRESLFVCNLHVSSLIPTESSRVTRVVGPLILNKVLLVLWSGRVGPERQTEDKVCRRNYSVVLLLSSLEQSERVSSGHWKIFFFAKAENARKFSRGSGREKATFFSSTFMQTRPRNDAVRVLHTERTPCTLTVNNFSADEKVVDWRKRTDERTFD